jgi:hypothetical protein
MAEYIIGRPKGKASSLTHYPQQKLPSLFIGFGKGYVDYLFHIHHWMWAFILGLIMLGFNQLEVSVFLAGVCCQGLSYPDRFYIRVEHY